MPTYPFQYKKIDFGQIINPIIYLPVKVSWGWQPLWFLVDSGADTSILSFSLAKELGLTFETNKSAKLTGIGSDAILAKSGTILIKIGGEEILVRSYFIDSIDLPPLLGRLDIFDKFKIEFNPMKKNISFENILGGK